jgi:glycosyltransferase involved in cell wall biosynthesis
VHILYLHQHFVARNGTSGGRSHEFSKILIEKGHKVTLITGLSDYSGLNDLPNDMSPRTILDGIDLRIIRVSYSQQMGMMRRILSFMQFMILSTWAALRIKSVDVVFATSTPLTIAVPGLCASLFHRRPFVFEVRDLWPDIPIQLGILRNPLLCWLARLLERTAYRRAAHIVALSPGIQEAIVAQGIPKSKTTLIPNSSDVNLFRVPSNLGRDFRGSHPEIGDRPLVVYAGAFGKVNGLEGMVKLASVVHLRDPDIRFLLVGDGSEKDRIMGLAKAGGLLNQNMFFMASVARRELPKILSAATHCDQLWWMAGGSPQKIRGRACDRPNGYGNICISTDLRPAG